MSALGPPVLVAPDSFKGTLRASEVAAALGRGFEAAGWEVDLCPVADGGEGLVEVLLPALGGETAGASVTGPLPGSSVVAGFALVEDGAVAVVESAAASGLALAMRESPGLALGGGASAEAAAAGQAEAAEIARGEAASPTAAAVAHAEAATSAGTGDLIVAAVDLGAEVVVVGAGGSAMTDGGRGAVDAIAEGGGLRGARLVVLCDVVTPWERAAAEFAPQKGADGAAVRRLAARLRRYAERLPRDPRGVAMTGAAGGLAGGLWAACDAELVGGAAWVLDTLGFDARMRAARAVVCGEGCLDGSSLRGKAVSEVATRARQAGVPCHAFVGRRELDAFGQRILDLQVVEEAGTLAALEAGAFRLGERMGVGEA